MKRFTAQILVLAVLFSLAACGKTATPDTAAENPRIQEILSAAEARKQAILSSETAIVKSDTYIMGETYTGTAVYDSDPHICLLNDFSS